MTLCTLEATHPVLSLCHPGDLESLGTAALGYLLLDLMGNTVEPLLDYSSNILDNQIARNEVYNVG